MKHLKSTAAGHGRIKGAGISAVKKTIACVMLLLPLAILSGCSGGGDDPAPATDPNTVTVQASNSAMPSRGVLRSQYDDSPVGHGIAKIVDNNRNTKFVTNHSTFHIHWEGSESVAVNYYSLTSADDAPEKDPKSWTLSGSADNSTWTVIDERTDQTFPERKQRKEFDLSNRTPYKYLRLDIKANNGATATQIAEMSIRMNVTNIDDLMMYASGFSESPTTPMGNHYANRHVTTDEDRAWLATASNEPSASQAGDSYSLTRFNVTLYPTAGNPSPADANQHGIGDCCAIAVFASFAYIYPDFIKSIITDNRDETFTIAMFDPQGKPVDVSVTSRFVADNSGTIQAVSGKNNVACWSTVLEKAMMKWNTLYKVNYNINGIGTEHVVPLFTGNGSSFAFAPGALNNEQLAKAVKVCLKQGRFVIGGFREKDVPIMPGVPTVNGHAYTFMYSSNSSYLFDMRNPWGGHGGLDDSKDGVLNIPNNDIIPPIIDLRIIEPGKAGKFGTGTTSPYTPPSFAPGTAGMRVSPELMRSGM